MLRDPNTVFSEEVKCVLDEVFGIEGFRNDVSWVYGGSGRGAKAIARQFPRNHDILLWYSKGNTPTYHIQMIERRVRATDAAKAGYRIDESGRWFKTAPRGDYTDESIAALEKQGRVYRTNSGSIRIKYFLRQDGTDVIEDVMVGDSWTDIPDAMHLPEAEKTGYPTQKPEALLERIIRASSNEGDLVLDCFCGSGTTAAVAEKLGRRWIAADLGRFAIHTTRKRLLSIPNVRPFDVQNLGKYERQAWQVAEFAEGDATQAPNAQLAYRRFMLDLYRAQPLDGYTWLHGVRDGRLVHVGSVDAPVAVGDVQQIVKEFWRVRTSPPNPLSQEERGRQSGGGVNAQEERGRQSGGGVNAQEERGRQSASTSGPPLPAGEGVARSAGGEVRSTGIDILGWDFAFELNEVAAQMAADAGVQLKFKRVPREVLEKKAVEQGDIKFFELAALDLKVSQRSSGAVDGVARALGPHVTITLSDFMVPTDDVPEEVVAAVKRWEQWIDYWAVDWDYKGDAFHNMAQTYRTRKDPRLQTTLAHTYDQPGEYTVVVKVIDILGNDTTKTLKVEVL